MWDIKLKDKKLFKSFQIEIIICSIISLFFTLLSELVLFFVVFYWRIFYKEFLTGTKENTIKIFDSMGRQLTDQVLYNSNSNSDLVVSPYLKSMKKEILIIFILALVIIGVVLFVVYFLLLTRKLTHYLKEICSGMNEIASGNFNTRIPVRNEDEFALIAQNINKMAADVSVIMESERDSEKVKHDLITSVAHDLRTPLTSIIGYLGLASKDKTDQQTKEKYVKVAYDKSKRLEQLIEDLFHFTKVSSGEIKPEMNRIDIVKLMEQLMEEFYPSFEMNGLESEFKTSDQDIFVIADGSLLARAFANLIGNAVTYGKDGKNIRVHIRKKDTTVKISVINYGELIPEEDINNIFNKFYRVEGSRSRNTGGTGLGLAIAKTIISMHEGTITAKSSYTGTVFEVILKLDQDV